MTKSRKIIGIALVIVYAFFFASTNFFYHTHQMATSRLVHSHPFNGQGHTHTAGQILLVNIIDSEIYQESSDFIIPDIHPVLLSCKIDGSPVRSESTCQYSSISLRAPPAKS